MKKYLFVIIVPAVIILAFAILKIGRMLISYNSLIIEIDKAFILNINLLNETTLKQVWGGYSNTFFCFKK